MLRTTLFALTVSAITLAAPAQTPPYACDVIGNGPLSFASVASLGPTGANTPTTFLRFSSLKNADGNAVLVASSTPESFAYFVCDRPGDHLFIRSNSNTANCIAATAVKEQNASLVSVNCDNLLNAGPNDTISEYLNFEAWNSTIGNYWTATFLGGTRQSTYSNKTDYSVSLASVDDGPEYVRIDYTPGAGSQSQGNNTANQILFLPTPQ